MKCKIKEKNGKCIWIYDNIKIVFSDGSFQAHDEYAYTHGINDMLYMYYRVRFYKLKKYTLMNKEQKSEWEKIYDNRAYDFPTLGQLKSIIELMLGDTIPLSDYTYHKYEEENYKSYNYFLETGGFMCDDYYAVRRSLIEEDEDKEEFFTLYVGNSGCPNSTGVFSHITSGIPREAMVKLLKCIDTFIDCMVKTHNEEVIKDNIKGINSFFIGGGKLYEREFGEKPIEDVYTIGDEVYVVVLEGKLDTNSFHSTEYHQARIREIKTNSIVFEIWTSKTEKNLLELPLEKLLFIMRNINIDDSYYEENFGTEKKIAKNFMTLLSEEEKQEFQQRDKKVIFKKWIPIIISRYSMYRDGYHFKNRVGGLLDTSEKERKNVKLAAKKVVKIIIKNMTQPKLHLDCEK